MREGTCPGGAPEEKRRRGGREFFLRCPSGAAAFSGRGPGAALAHARWPPANFLRRPSGTVTKWCASREGPVRDDRKWPSVSTLGHADGRKEQSRRGERKMGARAGRGEAGKGGVRKYSDASRACESAVAAALCRRSTNGSRGVLYCGGRVGAATPLWAARERDSPRNKRGPGGARFFPSSARDDRK